MKRQIIFWVVLAIGVMAVKTALAQTPPCPDITAIASGNSGILNSLVDQGDIKNIQLFIDCGADVNARDEEGRTPLFHAINVRSFTIITMLLDHGADPNARDNEGRTPVFAFFAFENNEYIFHNSRLYIGDANEYSFFGYGGENGFYYRKMIELIHRYGADLSATDNNGDNLLHYLTGREKERFFLIANSSSYDFERAFRSIHDSDFRKIFTDGDLESLSLGLSSYYNRHRLEMILVDTYGASVNSQNNDGNSPLHNAAENNNFKSAHFFMQKGGDAGLKNKYGETPVDLLAHRKTYGAEYDRRMMDEFVQSLCSAK